MPSMFVRNAFPSILFLSTACYAQFPLSIGIKGGVALTQDIQNTTGTVGAGLAVTAYSTSKDYIIGPMLDLRLPFRLGVEADALYRPFNIREYTSAPSIVAPDYSGAYGSWEFPVVAKYRFSFPIVKPYVDAGPSFRTTKAQPLRRISSDGFALGAGLDFHLVFLHLEPEIRYTHWAGDGAPTFATAFIRSNQNQAEFLVGLAF